MNKNMVLSVKNWAMLCVFASFAMLLYMPIYGSVYNDFILIIAASLICVRNKGNLTLQLLCISIIFASVFGLVSYYYDKNYLLSMQESLGGGIYYAIWFVVSMSPLFYYFFKTNDLCVKMGVTIVCIALIPGLLYVLTSPKLVDISLLMFSFVVVGFFLASAFDTNDKTTRNVSILAGLGGLIMVLRNIENIVWYVCEKPNLDGWYSCIDYNIEEFPVFNFCIKYNQTFTWLFLAGCAFMMMYFIYIFMRSNYSLKTICIPAIFAFLLTWFVSVGLYSSIDFFDHKYMTSFFEMVVYALFAFSFYKLYKKL